MDIEIAESVTIDRPAEAVYGVFTDIEASSRLISGIERIEMLTTGEFAAGTSWRETRRMFGREATEVLTVTQAEEPTFYVVTAQSQGTLYTTRVDFAEEGETTTVTMTFVAEPSTFVAKAMSLLGLLAKRATASAIRRDLEDLKAAAEHGTD